MSKKARFVYLAAVAIIVSGCAHNPQIISCPVPPGEYMTPAVPLPPLEGGSARQVFEALVKDQEAHAINSARLAGLQSWGRDQCGWVQK